MRALVTGAGGFVGAHTAHRLAALGHEVVATGRDLACLSKLAAAGCEVAKADLACDDLDAVASGCDVVVHCAARASLWGEPVAFWRDNVLATERLLAAARRTGTVRRFVFISSPSIYFRYRDQKQLTEAFIPPRRWLSAYAETKWIAECRVRAAPGVGPVILRPRAIFGPGDRAIVPRLIAVARRGFFPLPGNGTAWVDVTYVDNVVAAIERALVADDRAIEGQAFNVTNGEPVQVRDLLTRLFTALGMSVRLLPLPRAAALVLAQFSESFARLRPGRPEPRLTRYGIGLLGYTQTLSLDRARNVLGYVPQVSVDAGLQRYAQWWAQQ